MKIWICDDGESVCAELEAMINHYFKDRNIWVDVDVWYSGKKLLEHLQKGEEQPDILFLDIELLEMKGMEVADCIRNQMENRGMQIVYISGKTSYARELFKTQPLDFLEKPIKQEDIDEVLALAFKLIRDSGRKFEYRVNKEYQYIPHSDILYFVSEGKRIIIRTTDGKELEFHEKLSDVVKRLPKRFAQIHQSYVINKEHVTALRYDSVVMDTGELLTISKPYRGTVREHILREAR